MNPYAILGAVVAAGALCLGSAQVGRKLERTGWQAKEIAAAQAAKASTDRLIAEAESQRERYALLQKASNEKHESELRAVDDRRRADVGKRVPIGATFCVPGDTPRQASGTGGAGQAGAATQFLPDTFASDLRQLAADADEMTANLRALVTETKGAGVFMGYDEGK